jgi:hypothetical protein
MLQGLILIDALSSAYWERKEKKKKRSSGGVFPGLESRHALLAVPGGIFFSY